jgi:hypothetical protein
MDESIREALSQLVAEGLIEIIGRTASGNPVYASTQKPGFVRRMWWRVRFVLFFPALVAEWSLGWTALAIGAGMDEIPSWVVTMALTADRLRDWRIRNDRDPASVWLSIRPE